MQIVGIAVGSDEVEELGRRLAESGAHETANRLLRAERRGAREIALDALDQQRLLDADALARRTLQGAPGRSRERTPLASP